MENLTKILEQFKDNSLSIEDTEQQILNLFGKGVPEELIEEPILIGKLNKVFGYNGFEKIEIGTDVYLFKDRYQFEIIPLNGNVPMVQKFYKEDLKPSIDFIDEKL